MRVTITGATGLIGPAVVAELRDRGAQITVLSRNPQRAAAELQTEAVSWDPLGEAAPSAALAGRDAVVHLAGAPVAQRWNASARQAIRESRVRGTRNLIEGLRAVGAGDGAHAPAPGAPDGGRPRVLVSASAIGYYGPHGDEPLDEEAPPGSDFLAQVCVDWEAHAREGAEELGMRSVQVRTGVVLDRHGGALAKMLTPFRLGVGGPVAGGRQWVSWIHREDLVGLILAAARDERWAGPLNATAPDPVTNRELSTALGHALHRPSLLPVPALALRVLYGEMAEIVTRGARVLPAKALVLGYQFRHPRLGEALRSALA
jgi:uncharacterized protein (TIGR01777 family)